VLDKIEFFDGDPGKKVKKSVKKKCQKKEKSVSVGIHEVGEAGVREGLLFRHLPVLFPSALETRSEIAFHRTARGGMNFQPLEAIRMNPACQAIAFGDGW
jgi:hypothetical protein